MKTGQATEAQVRAIPLPREVIAEARHSTTWTPLRHRDVLDRLDNALSRKGLEVARDEGGTERRTFTLARDGAQMYVALPLRVNIDPSIRMMIGIVNSFNKSLALRIGFGSEVHVCTNGLIFAQQAIRLRHIPSSIGENCENLDASLDEALGMFDYYLSEQRRFYNGLREVELTDRDAHDLVVRMSMVEAITSGDIRHVVDQWHSPRFEEFEHRTAYSLLNAATDVYRRGRGDGGVAQRNGVTFSERSTRLAQFFSDEFFDGGINFEPVEKSMWHRN